MRGSNKLDRSGQAATEYLLLLFVVLAIFYVALQTLKGANIVGQVSQPMAKTYSAAYRYGHPLAKGYDDPGGPDHHPRAYGGNNFRLYINPE